MSKRLYFAAGLALGLLSLSPSATYAQASQITVEWESAPLSDVLSAFAKFSGRTITVAPDVGNPSVTASVKKVAWDRALDTIVSGLGLVARVDVATGSIRIEKKP